MVITMVEMISDRMLAAIFMDSRIDLLTTLIDLCVYDFSTFDLGGLDMQYDLTIEASTGCDLTPLDKCRCM